MTESKSGLSPVSKSEVKRLQTLDPVEMAERHRKALDEIAHLKAEAEKTERLAAKTHALVLDEIAELKGKILDAETDRDTYHSMLSGEEYRHGETKAKLARAREALRDVMNNLGVPQPGYPAPVAVAYEIAREALEEIEAGPPSDPTPAV